MSSKKQKIRNLSFSLLLMVLILCLSYLNGNFKLPFSTASENLRNEKLDSNRMYQDERGGFTFRIPEGFSLTKRDEYYELISEQKSSYTIFIITNADIQIESAYDYLLALRGLRERMQYTLDEKLMKTSLFDPNPQIESVEGRYLEVVEFSNVYLNQGLLAHSITHYFEIDSRGIAIGYLSTEDSEVENVVQEIIATIEPKRVESQTDCEFRTEIVEGIKIDVPENLKKYEDDQFTLFYAPVESGSAYYGFKIIILKDDSKKKNEFRVIDRTFEISNSSYARALSQEPRATPLRTLEYRMISEEKEVKTGDKNYLTASFDLTLVSALKAPISTLPDYSLKSRLYSFYDESKSINVLFCAPEENILEFSKRCLEVEDVSGMSS